MHRRSLLGATLLALCALPLVAGADEPLPKAEAILDKFVEATGGAAAYDNVRNEITRGTIQMPAQGLSGSIVTYHAANRTYSIVDFQGVGAFEEGFDGTIAWSNSAMQGARIKEGDERAAAKLGAQLNQSSHWREIYSKVETAGVEDVEGKPAYKVLATPKEGSPMTVFYDRQSGLLVKLVMTLKTAMGDMPVETYLSDYRPSDGLLTPRQVKQNVGPQSILVTVDKIERNVDLPSNRFDSPEAVKKLAASK